MGYSINKMIVEIKSEVISWLKLSKRIYSLVVGNQIEIKKNIVIYGMI